MSDAGGIAWRLATHPAPSTFRVSPDGKWIAPTANDNQDASSSLCRGRRPRRLTQHPGPDQVVGWTPDGAKVLFRSRAENPQAWELRSSPMARTGEAPTVYCVSTWTRSLDDGPSTARPGGVNPVRYRGV